MQEDAGNSAQQEAVQVDASGSEQTDGSKAQKVVVAASVKYNFETGLVQAKVVKEKIPLTTKKIQIPEDAHDDDPVRAVFPNIGDFVQTYACSEHLLRSHYGNMIIAPPPKVLSQRDPN